MGQSEVAAVEQGQRTISLERSKDAAHERSLGDEWELFGNRKS
jgi:hypothetical protein